MATKLLIVLAAVVQLASAHFQIIFPSWRSNSLTNANYSQWVYPCAGVPSGVAGDNRTDWSPAAGLSLDLHHPWTYVFVNLGLGENVTNFNYTLTPGAMLNETGNGTLCIPSLPVPSGFSFTDGQIASLQVVTLGASGDALYNCADITLRTTVAAYGGASCSNDTGVSVAVVNQEVNGSTAGSSGSKSPASGNRPSLVAATSVVGLALALVYGMSL